MWAQVLNTLLGLWLMAAPALFDYADTPAAVSHRIVGPVVVSFAFIALWRATRPVRLVNLPLGFWLIVSPGLLTHVPSTLWISFATGTLICVFSLPGHRSADEFAGGWGVLFRKAVRGK